jgi:hypothetical protein
MLPVTTLEQTCNQEETKSKESCMTEEKTDADDSNAPIELTANKSYSQKNSGAMEALRRMQDRMSHIRRSIGFDKIEKLIKQRPLGAVIEHHKLLQSHQFNPLLVRHPQAIDPKLQASLDKLKALQSSTLPNLKEIAFPHMEINSAFSELQHLPFFKIPDHIKLAIDAGSLYQALTTNDELTALDIMACNEPVFPLLQQLLTFAEMPIETRLAVMEETNEELLKEMSAFRTQNKNRIEKAIASRKINAKSHEINSYFLKLENAGRNLFEKGITRHAATEFEVTIQHVRNLRKKYLLAKAEKKRN